MFRKTFQPGDRIVYRKTKHSRQPGPRAEAIVPAQRGDDYAYCVDKYWIVRDLTDENQLRVITRTGKTHLLDSNDPNLRHANLWERWFLSERFPEMDADRQADVSSGA